MCATTAVICEFNPIHPGHRHLISVAKAGGDALLCVMSGHFTERAEPALYDKYVRAKAALLCGADLVVELPYPWSASGAEEFARGGCGIAGALGADSLTFGSESGDLSLLMRAADFRSSADFAEKMRRIETERRGGGSASLYEAVLAGEGIALGGGNDRLGVEYIRAGREAGIREFRPVRRMTWVPSSSEIRRVFRERGADEALGLAAEEARALFRESGFCPAERYDELLFAHARLYLAGGNDLLRYAVKAARMSTGAAEFTARLPTKKYTAARMRRELLFSLLGAGSTGESPAFTVLLAANERGREILAGARRPGSVPVLVKPADTAPLDERAKRQYALNNRADELWAYLTGQEAGAFMKAGPYIET
ncbi:MAG: nucleotidyltransferase family protein [Clostridiales bacterium]|nr:nucleotidyltransferase family protein [Clostridiales bacterium]